MYPVIFDKQHLNKIFDILRNKYIIIGSRLRDGVIVLDELNYNDIPIGYSEHEEPGGYRLHKEGSGLFSFTHGPDSLKKFLHLPYKHLCSFEKTQQNYRAAKCTEDEQLHAFFGVKSCDIAALKVLDRVFGSIENRLMDVSGFEYTRKRQKAFIVAVNCTRAGNTCFCASMNTGPEVKDGYDIGLTELESVFLAEAGSERGKSIIESLPIRKAEPDVLVQKEKVLENCRSSMKRSMKTNDLPEFLYRNFDSPRWKETARRCLACGNCTLVCPTCFCNSVFDCVTLSGIKSSNDYRGQRIRSWDSCFFANFARVHGGNFRLSRKARYRHWINHKLAYWIEEFGVSGCVGCGRCITWCPVGIDITEELQALRDYH
jgi:sulfhydrogenase subunit beta (sulfur reductase)